jgi:hypothetical protein
MEWLIEALSFALQRLDVDSFLDLFGGFDQTFMVTCSCLLAIVQSDPFGRVCLAHLDNPYLIGLDRIFRPLERISIKHVRCSELQSDIFAMAKRSIAPSQLSCHMKC